MWHMSSKQMIRRRVHRCGTHCGVAALSARQHGFTLVEALIALVVLSIGLLGVAKLVISAVHADDSAYMRGQATQLAYQMLDQVRANRPAALDGGYAAAPAVSDCITGACAPDTLAADDLYNWKARLGEALPSGTGTVTITADGNDEVATIAVTWDDSLAQWAFGTPAYATPSVMTVTLESVL
jgi:type IV pilus assembly protein PilV